MRVFKRLGKMEMVSDATVFTLPDNKRWQTSVENTTISESSIFALSLINEGTKRLIKRGQIGEYSGYDLKPYLPPGQDVKHGGTDIIFRIQ